MFGFDPLTAASLLVLAANTVQCGVPKAPHISITPLSSEIEYDFNLTAEELGQFKSGTVNPYAPGTDVTTGGLRHDRPEVKTGVKWGMLKYDDRQVACLWYQSIDITIGLHPKIFIARDEPSQVCQDAIIEHELKHVAVDREIINLYSQQIGQAVKKAVDGIGAMGPYNYHELDKVQKELVGHIETAVDSQSFLLYQEMSRRQGEVDSLQEYERVSKICEEAKK